MDENRSPIFPENIEALSLALKDHFSARSRIQILYSPADPTDPAGGTVVYLEKIRALPGIDRTNCTLTFQAGTPVSEILNSLSTSPYSPEPFSGFNPDFPAGIYFTHSRIFGADALGSMTVAMPDGELVRFGSRAYTSVAGYNVMDLFLGTRNLLGIPVSYTFKLLPRDYPAELKGRRYQISGSHDSIDPEERRILLRLKCRYDPQSILNTFEL